MNNELLDALASLGFPAFVTGWLLLRTDRRLDGLYEKLTELSQRLAKVLVLMERRANGT